MKLVVDSSVFVAFFNDQDLYHRETSILAEKFAKDKSIELILPVIIFLEVAHVLSKKLENFKEDLILKTFATNETVSIDLSLAMQILPVMKTIDLKTSDAIILAITKIADATLITWDKKLQKEAQEFVEVLTPKEFMRKY